MNNDIDGTGLRRWLLRWPGWVGPAPTARPAAASIWPCWSVSG
jgi:hypothetical protein